MPPCFDRWCKRFDDVWTHQAQKREFRHYTEANKREEIRLDKLAESLPAEAFAPVQLNLDKPKTVWVATVEVELSQLEGTRTIAIVMNASTFAQASDTAFPFITQYNSRIWQTSALEIQG